VNLITHSCEEGIDPQLCQHSLASRYNQNVHINCQYHPDHCWQGWFCFRALPMIKTKSFLQVPWKYIFRYPPGQWSIFNINQTNPKAIFLVRLRYPNRKLTRKLFHNAFTLWLLHNRQDQTLWLFFVAVPLVIPQCIQSQSCTEEGNENPVLHTIPQQ
jgi:hypothetical protein